MYLVTIRDILGRQTREVLGVVDARRVDAGRFVLARVHIAGEHAPMCLVHKDELARVETG